jgi:hypothetical protein
LLIFIKTDALLKHWLKAEKADVKEKIVKMRHLFEKAAILVHPTQRGGGGPHVCVEFAKRGLC